MPLSRTFTEMDTGDISYIYTDLLITAVLEIPLARTCVCVCV